MRQGETDRSVARQRGYETKRKPAAREEVCMLNCCLVSTFSEHGWTCVVFAGPSPAVSYAAHGHSVSRDTP